MAARSLGSGTISFGLVAIPIRLYPAAVSERVSFHLLHAKCGSRINYQAYCPVCDQVVDRRDLVKAYELGKDQYVRVTDDELEALEGEASKQIDITEFVPLASVDPVYFDRAYFLGPDKGGGKAYHLLARALRTAQEVALARFILRGKESLVLIRPFEPNGGLILHTMYFHDEIRAFGEIDEGESGAIEDNELKLALRLIEELGSASFDPQKYEDQYRQRLLRFIKDKAEGQEVTAAPAAAPRGQVIDLMEALKKSLGREGQGALRARRRARSGAAPASTRNVGKRTARAGKR
ncbi:MAG TPA: Ku protein [Candidatus Methylomirabilis sp.]|nr:Ku protein [Candidatus Methylomirabilis sp.]